MSTAPNRKFTLEEYLALERKCEYKSQFYRGEIFAMAGGTKRHSKMKVNVVSALSAQLKSGPCTVYDSDLKVMIATTGLVTYPDASVACEREKYYDDNDDVLLNPTLVVEVLSPSTESYDRGRKSEDYRKLESLKEYVLISHDYIHLERYTRQVDGQWSLAEVNQFGQSLQLESIGCVLRVDDVYAKVQFRPEGDSPGQADLSWA